MPQQTGSTKKTYKDIMMERLAKQQATLMQLEIGELRGRLSKAEENLNKKTGC